MFFVKSIFFWHCFSLQNPAAHATLRPKSHPVPRFSGRIFEDLLKIPPIFLSRSWKYRENGKRRKNPLAFFSAGML